MLSGSCQGPRTEGCNSGIPEPETPRSCCRATRTVSSPWPRAPPEITSPPALETCVPVFGRIPELGLSRTCQLAQTRQPLQTRQPGPTRHPAQTQATSVVRQKQWQTVKDMDRIRMAASCLCLLRRPNQPELRLSVCSLLVFSERASI